MLIGATFTRIIRAGTGAHTTVRLADVQAGSRLDWPGGERIGIVEDAQALTVLIEEKIHQHVAIELRIGAGVRHHQRLASLRMREKASTPGAKGAKSS